jgi:hypothetical protein
MVGVGFSSGGKTLTSTYVARKLLCEGANKRYHNLKDKMFFSEKKSNLNNAFMLNFAKILLKDEDKMLK